jgi:hypothetical protein
VIEESTLPGNGFDFDPDLPRLRDAFDLEAVARMFEAELSVSDGSRPVSSVAARKLLDTKYEPRRWCVTTYELALRSDGASPVQTIGALETRPAERWLRLYDQDPAMPWMADATDADSMKRRFAATFGELRSDHSNALLIQPIRYKPGARCVIRYALTTGSEPAVFFGKIVTTDADRLAAELTALQRASETRLDMPRIAGPAAYWPDLRMLVQPAVIGQEFHDVAFDPALEQAVRERWMAAAGRALAALHAMTDVPAARRTMQDDADELDELTAPMAQVSSELAARFRHAVDGLRGLGDSSTSPYVASHGAFRTDQFMIRDEELVLIDLDTFCWARPERDIGNLFAYLQWKALRQPQHASLIEVAPRRFLEGYSEVGPAPDERETMLYRAASLLKIAGRRFRSLTVREWPKVPHLIASAQTLLDECATP